MKTNMKEIGLALVLALAAFAANASQTTYYIYDKAGHVIGEYDANGNPIEEHVYLGDRPVAVVQGGNTSNIGYVTTDQQGTPRAITDSQKNVVWTWNSDPYGNGQPSGSITYNMRFPGQYYDAETGHSYNYHRDYDSATGRYTESDPSGLEGGTNTYAYVSGNPVGLVDPFGLCGDSPSAPSPNSPEPTPTPPADGGGSGNWNCLQNKWASDRAALDQWAMLYGDPGANFTNALATNFQNDVSSQGRNDTSIVANGDVEALNDLGNALARAGIEAGAMDEPQAAVTVGEQTPTIFNAAMDVGTGILAFGQALLGGTNAPPVPTLLPDNQVCPP